jgi:hypothetical protein
VIWGFSSEGLDHFFSISHHLSARLWGCWCATKASLQVMEILVAFAKNNKRLEK